ncbi:hypothetical protein BH10PSE18_BH10PSE18_18180 [soil metagenome]
MFCTCSRICSISTFMSTPMRVSSSAADFDPSVFASRCSSWIRKSSRLPISPPFFTRRSISSRCELRRVSSSATSMRIAKAVASVSARSCAASGSVPPVRPIASCQRSRKRVRCCSTSCGTNGAACVASLRNCAKWSLSIVARRAPSRSRAAIRLTSAFSVTSSSGALQSPRAVVSPPASRSTSATLSSRALGSQARMPSCRPFRRCSSRVDGSAIPACAVLSIAARSSTLPRLSLPVSSSRKAGSCCRSSSGSLNVRSRNRLLTDRISIPSRAAAAGLASVSGGLATGPFWPLA